MSYSHHLQKNSGIIDPLILSSDVSSSFFVYKGYNTTKNYFITRRDINPSEAAPLFGSKSTFKIPIIADKVGPLQLLFTLPPIVPQVQGNTPASVNPRYQDFIGYVAWEKIEFLYATQEIYTIYPEDCWFKFRRFYRQDQKDAIAKLVKGDQTVPQRIADATATQDIIVDLPLPHTRSMNRWIELMQLAHEPRIEITWKKLADLVQDDNNGGYDPTQQLTNVLLKATYLHVDGDERDFYTASTESQNGIIRLIDDFKMEKVIVPTGTPIGEYRIKINNFRSSTKIFKFIIRKWAKTQQNTLTGNRYFDDLQGPTDIAGVAYTIKYWYLEGADGRIIEPVYDRYDRYYLHMMYHNSPASTAYYEWSFAMNPDDPNNGTGTYNFGNTTNLTLVIYFNQQLQEPLEVTMAVNEYNTVQEVRGDFMKNFK
jgi:hypothetical protein